MTMMHPGLPLTWIWLVLAFMTLATFYLLVMVPRHIARMSQGSPTLFAPGRFKLAHIPGLKSICRLKTTTPFVQLSLRIVMVVLFGLIIATGLMGTPIPERNLATVLTWSLWWSGLIVTIAFLGSAWCAVCPWDTISSWLVNQRLYLRGSPLASLNLKVPKVLRTVWPALILLVALTWFELGMGVTQSPYATAVLALVMLVLATASLAIFERRAFCRHFCPVGRTIGFYAQLAPVELRPIEPSICVTCQTLECYQGTPEIEPCPTHQVMGTMKQNTYCTSCGNCSRSCPHSNVSWRLRSPSVEAISGARPHWDEAWFMIGLLALTGFHGLTMMAFWRSWVSEAARMLGDSGQFLMTFTIGLLLYLAVVGAIYAATIWLTIQLTANPIDQHDNLEAAQQSRGRRFEKTFSRLAFTTLPMAFAYHLAHNLNHLIREGAGIGTVLTNPFGTNTTPLSMAEKHARHSSMLISQDVLFSIQAVLMASGFLIAVLVIRHRGAPLLENKNVLWPLVPMLTFAVFVTAFHLWLLHQPMIMRF